MTVTRRSPSFGIMAFFRLELTRQIDLEFGLSFVHDHQIRVHTLLHLAARQTVSTRMTALAFA